MLKHIIDEEHRVLGVGQPVFVLITGIIQTVSDENVTIQHTESGKKWKFKPHQVQRFADNFLPAMRQAKEYIHLINGDEDGFLCLCGNCEPMGHFYPCDKEGNEIDPDEVNYGYLSACGGCGRIIDQNDLSVVGQNPNPSRID